MTQPVVAIQRDSIRQNDSMPIIENKFLAPARSISRASFSRTRQQSIGDNHSEYSFMFTARATPSIASSASLRSFTRPLTRKDIFYSGSIKNIPEFNQSQNLSQFRQSMMSIPRSTRRFTEVIEEEAIEEERNFFDALWGLLGFSLLKDKKMALLAISSVFGMLGFYVPFVYIIDAAVSKGIDSTMADYLLSIIGVTNIVGRLLSGYSADMPSVDSLLVTNICIALSGVFIFCVPLVNGFAGMAGCTCWPVWPCFSRFYRTNINCPRRLVWYRCTDKMFWDNLHFPWSRCHSWPTHSWLSVRHNGFIRHSVLCSWRVFGFVCDLQFPNTSCSKLL
ncbi:uncharacterized protein LOC136029105 [Artemia franciscana]|uniref:uncharacterized protein LOC136029105 n=1 Tax=Artemia franciscana TaxID=6661 RepID=UPI0032DAFEB9